MTIKVEMGNALGQRKESGYYVGNVEVMNVVRTGTDRHLLALVFETQDGRISFAMEASLAEAVASSINKIAPMVREGIKEVH